MAGLTGFLVWRGGSAWVPAFESSVSTMRTIKRYITVSFLGTFFLTLIVLTVVMCLALIFKINDLLVRGVPAAPIFQIMLSGVPQMLAISIPVSVMTACLLVFGRLSADGEITAMKACGVSLRQIMAGPVLASVALTLACVWLNQEAAPKAHYRRRSIRAHLLATPPIELLDEGRFVQDFPGLTIYIGSKDGKELTDIRLWDMREGEQKREIRAKKGRFRSVDNGTGIELELEDVCVDHISDEVNAGMARCELLTVRLENLAKERKYRPREKDKTLMDLAIDMRNIEEDFPRLTPEEQAVKRTRLEVELHKRLALSASCLAFAMLGIPLGIKAHRRESSIGAAMSLVLVFNFYLFIIIAESLVKFPAVRPSLIVWVPVVFSMVGGVLLARRHS